MVKRAITCVMTTVSVLAVVLAAHPASAQTVDEIVARNYASKGGLEKWKSIQTQRLTGAVSTQGIELGMVILGKRPNLGRQDLTIDMGQGPMTMVNIFDGAKAWMINPMTGSDVPQEMGGPEGESVKDQSDFDGALIDYKAKGHTVELVGPATVGAALLHRRRDRCGTENLNRSGSRTRGGHRNVGLSSGGRRAGPSPHPSDAGRHGAGRAAHHQSRVQRPDRRRDVQSSVGV
jgi:hypothetical protein